MRIEKMHATFGKLREQTLTLAPGMNVICGGNESGKSTWSAFLRVMLYGVSTREKSKTGFLADKEKYAPWSGEPMYGKIEFTWQGRRCVLERRSGRGGVLQKAQISDRDTGEVLDIPEPVGDTLLGVRREVFERSAFIAQAQLPLSGDKTGELEQRITALSTTGEEDLSQKLVLDRLKKWQNAIQYNRRGALPDHLARRELVRKNLDMIVANDVTRPGAGFDVDTNIVTLITRKGQEALPMMTKAEVADRILDHVLNLKSV